MINKNKSSHFFAGSDPEKSVFFTVGIIMFIVMAVLGWFKLRYGFNYIDEGMYMVDGWRLTAGDELFPDSSISVVMLYSLFNALIFKLSPEITLYDFRQIQYFLNIFALLLFSYSISRWSRQIWFIPFVFSIFAFTGLDPVGMTVNLNYYTYPHLFIILYTSFLILAIKCEHRIQKTLLYITAGCMLWAVGFSLLPLSLGIVSPVLLWVAARYINSTDIQFTTGDLLLVISPGIILWCVFVGYYNEEFFHAMADVYRYSQEGISSGISLNLDIIPYFLIVLMSISYYLYVFKLENKWGLALACMLSIFMFSVLDTNLFGYIPGYWRGWFSAQMWFSALLVLFISLFTAATFINFVKKTGFNRVELLLVIIVIPALVFTVLFGYVSSMGILSSLHVSVLTVAGIALFVVSWLGKLESRGRFLVPVALVIFFTPFYYNLALGDWRFTYFDQSPNDLTYEFIDGFASGIKTNELFYNLAGWIESNVAEYSRKNDFLIVQDEAPMVYMIAKRRPALNHSWTGWSQSLSLQQDSIEQMIRDGRHPTIALRFIRSPMFFPESLKDGTFKYFGRHTYDANHPVTKYINRNMQLKDVLKIGRDPWVKFYVHKDSM